MNFSEYINYDALGLVNLIRKKEITPSEIIDISLRAIEQINPKINAIIGNLEKETEDALKRNNPNKPFSGVPFLIKDLGFLYKDILCENGSRLTQGLISPIDSELGKRFKKSGVITLGRTNTPEFGHNCTTEPLVNGPTRNPWNLSHIPGGSSGGSAAAVSAGIVPIAHASDGGGSIRLPASCCGIFGMKPSRGRVPNGPNADEYGFGIGVSNTVSRSVRDSAAMLDVISGPDIGTRILIPKPENTFFESSQLDPKKLRIAFSTKAFNDGPIVNKEVREAVLKTAKSCEELGHEVEENMPNVNLSDIKHIHMNLASTGVRGMDWFSKQTGRPLNEENLESCTLATIKHGRPMLASDLESILDLMNSVSRSTGSFFSKYDIWLTPVMTSPPIKLGILNANAPNLTVESWFDQLFTHIPFTPLYNQTGLPAMTIPLCWSSKNLPIGIQFGARLGDESTLFQLAGQLERSYSWHHYKPQFN